MLLKRTLWGLCLLASMIAGMRPLRMDSIPYLEARQNTSADASVPDVSNLCALGPPSNNSISEVTGAVTMTCSDCITVSGVVVGTTVPSSLIPTNQTASYASDGINNKRAPLTVIPRETLMPRVSKPIPLADPDADGQALFMETLRENIPQDGVIKIVPSANQLATWTIPLQINGKTVNTPIGVTGVWYPWPNGAKNFKMVGMHGCTGVLIVGNSGFWAGHFWESALSTNVNGGSSFNYRYGFGKDDVEMRPLADFKTIATNILGAPAPAGADTFVSLLDLQANYGDPFGRGNGGGDIYIITKAAGSTPSQQSKLMYAQQIGALQTAIQKYVRPNSVTIRPYIGVDDEFTPPTGDDWERTSPAGVPYTLNGVSILQYSPFAGSSTTNCPEARARVWEETNPVAAVDRKWAANVALNKRDATACGLPSPTASSSSAIEEPPCLPFEDPDSGMYGGMCQCSNGAKIPMVTTTNSAGSVNNCPWTTIPPQALITPAPASTSSAQYQYTYTDISKKVIECQTFSTEDFGGYPVSFCVGSSAVIYEPPVASMELGSSKVNVGSTMTGEALFTSVSNAVMSLCPTPTSDGAWTSCATGVVEVGEATWLNDKEPEKGKLTVHLTDAQYNSTKYLDLFVQMLAGAANASATGTNCNLLDWTYVTEVARRDIDGRMIVPPGPIVHSGNDTFCNINSFFDTQFYDGVQETAKMWFEAEFGFDLGELGNFDCISSIGAVGEVLGAIFDTIFPEFAWLIETGVQLGELACEAAETFNPARSRRDIEMDKIDAKLARAWEKEMKKDRKLPIPEHKKRELGLID